MKSKWAFHFITSIPKSLSEIRITTKHSGYQTFMMDSVNSPMSVLRDKEHFTPSKNLFTDDNTSNVLKNAYIPGLRKCGVILYSQMFFSW